MNQENTGIQQFYNKYSSSLNHDGYNHRHYEINKWLHKFGIQSHYNVLEVGCGPGHSAINLVNAIKTGKIVGADISSENIKLAKELHKNVSNIEFIVSDMSDFKYDLKFDLIVLPDVLEHIPMDQHHELFKTFRKHLKDTGKVIIHIPDPEYLEYAHIHLKEVLQVIDQPLHTAIVSNSLKGTGLRITYLESYSLSAVSPDYQLICLQPNDIKQDYSPKPWDMSFKSRFRRRIQKIMGIPSFN